MPKRKDYITWDEYFMGIAELSAERSKDPNTQVGACIVNDENKILSIGYNGFPTGCSDDNISWELHNIYHAQYLPGFLSPIACEKAKMILSRYFIKSFTQFFSKNCQGLG